jgi:hypothetical protein
MNQIIKYPDPLKQKQNTDTDPHQKTKRTTFTYSGKETKKHKITQGHQNKNSIQNAKHNTKPWNNTHEETNKTKAASAKWNA